MLASVTWITRHDQRWRLTDRFCPPLVGRNQWHGRARSAAIVTDDGAWLDRRYVPPPTVTQANANAPNLLVMYLESIERTYSNELFGDAWR